MDNEKDSWSVDNIADLKPKTNPFAEVEQSEVSMRAVDALDIDTSVASVKDVTRYLPIENSIDLAVENEVSRIHTEVRERGYRMYLSGGSPASIARKLKLSNDVITFWVKDGNWAERLKRRNDILEGAVRENVRSLRLSRAEEESRESLDIGKCLRKRVKDHLDAEEMKLSPGNLKMLADAAKATGDLGARGMGESIEPKQVDDKTEKRSLVVMINGGGLPPVREVVIDNDTGKEITE